MFRCSNCICYKNTTAYGTHNLFFHKMVDMAVNVDEGSSEDEEIHDKEIFSKTLFHYQEMSDEMETRGNQLLIDILQTGAITCLICIDNVKRLDAIWNCVNCYCILHLPCIQKWAREGANQQQFSSQGKFDKEDSIWNCPKCRFEYKGMECLVKYTCFCGKENDPCFDPWIVPHSCGQTCSKSLRPNCGHECILLCHPGPCPPCPKTILSRCYCENSNPQLQRCSKKGWSCGQPCGKLSSCGIHYCEDFCHSGDCSPCSKMGKHFCLCKKVEDMQPCAKRNWSCSQVCHKVLSCGHHLCEKECHASPCGECPRFGSRKCPCGKTSFSLPCVDDVSTCEDTCLKLLSCGSHQCAKRCHYGPCETCIQVVRKVCKCQHKVKEVPCNQALMCEFKCLKLRKCGRHACKKKCCNGNCPPCEQVCNRILNCNNHKCPSTCHSGICYPCPISKKVSCFCGNTSILVPCGKEKSVKPPNCKELCRIPSACHQKVQAHQCHFGDCPLCSEVCNKELPCSHHCQVKCHDEVLKENIGEKFQTKNTDGLISKRSPCVPCPPCSYLVEKFCVGEHCVESFPCSKVKAYSCKFFCGRLISCGNHVCKRKCHLVKGNPPQGKAGKNCMSCKEVCLKSRTTGCVHNCKLACHPGECPPCDEYLKLDCHCHLVKLYIKCQEFTLANDHQKEELLSCKSRCTKVLQCGHFCKKLCHNGNCSDSLSCAEKSHLSCSCGRRKKVLLCADVSCGMELECDEQCIDLKMKKQQVDEAKIIANKLAQIKRDQDELKLYENRKKGRKRSHKHQTCFPDNLDVSFSFKQSYLCRVLWLFFVFCLCIITMSLLII